MPRVNRFTEAMKRLGEVSSCRQRKGVREKGLKYPGNAAAAGKKNRAAGRRRSSFYLHAETRTLRGMKTTSLTSC